MGLIFRSGREKTLTKTQTKDSGCFVIMRHTTMFRPINPSAHNEDRDHILASYKGALPAMPL
jgi:hypothetical protein